MSRHPLVPADVDPADLADLVADAAWLLARDAEAASLRPVRAARPLLVAPRTIDITDSCVALTHGFGE